MQKDVNITTKIKARELRKNLSPAEKKLWSCFRSKQFLGLHIRKQHPIVPYIADFFISTINLVVELDGYSHTFSPDKDASRDQYLKDRGYKVIRISNHDVLHKLKDVLEFLRIVCLERLDDCNQLEL
jgi:very-short-patch-repair endonuclease